MKIKFIEVGRDKSTFTAECKTMNYKTLLKQVKKILFSKEVDFSYNKEKNDGLIMVGGFRVVGHFEVVK